MTENFQYPWNFHPDLIENRLRVIADFLIDVRVELVPLHEPAKGDTPWGFGCRAYDRARSKIIQAANTLPWLKVIDASMRLIFTIGNVPVRFYKGEADDPTDRTLAQTFPELNQMSLAFEHAETGGSADQQPVWRFAVETDVNGSVQRIVLCGFVGGEREVACRWVRNIDDPDRLVQRLKRPDGLDAIQLPPARVSVPKVDAGEDIVDA